MADDRPRNESGQYNDRLPLETVLDVFDRRDDLARPITAGDVVDALDVSQRTALNKLNELVAAGSLDSRTVGARARVFWRPILADGTENEGEGGKLTPQGRTFVSALIDDPDADPAAGERNQGKPERIADLGDTGDTPEHVERDLNDVSAESVPESVAAVIGGLDFPGSGAKLDARREAVSAAVEYLRKHGTAKPADFQRDVYPEYPARHTEEENPARAWWKHTVSDGLKQVAERTESIDPADTAGVWTWTGEGSV